MAYTQLTMSPAVIQFARTHGATGFHFGVLGALPAGTFLMQFFAAVAVNHMTHRRRLWLVLSIIQRLICLPIALGPLLLPEVPDVIWIWSLILSTLANHAMLHFCAPLWLSWMGDYLPHEGLNEFWGRRHVGMQWTAALTLGASALLLFGSGWHPDVVFAVLICVGAVAGVADILIFLKVEEPPVTQIPQPRLSHVLAAPFKDRGFRSFIGYTCFWQFAAMTAAPFITVYMLDYLHMSLAQVFMVWTVSWAGGGMLSGHVGQLVERHGHRPMLILCTALKSVNMVALLLVPFLAPAMPLLILMPVFVIDSLLNAGIAVSSNGFLIKKSPKANRTMYIAAGTALAGLIGGVTSVLSGILLVMMGDWSITWAGVALSGFHVMFVISLVLRLTGIRLAWAVHEPDAKATRYVISELVGATPLRILRYPLGLYRSLNGGLSAPTTVIADQDTEQTDVDKPSTPDEPLRRAG